MKTTYRFNYSIYVTRKGKMRKRYAKNSKNKRWEYNMGKFKRKIIFKPPKQEILSNRFGVKSNPFLLTCLTFKYSIYVTNAPPQMKKTNSETNSEFDFLFFRGYKRCFFKYAINKASIFSVDTNIIVFFLGFGILL